jgi:hypothetical protein
MYDRRDRIVYTALFIKHLGLYDKKPIEDFSNFHTIDTIFKPFTHQPHLKCFKGIKSIGIL